MRLCVCWGCSHLIASQREALLEPGLQGGPFPPQGQTRLGPVPSLCTYLAIQSKQEEHNEEKDGPKRGKWHHCHGFRVGDEGQART